jgi:DNA-binding MarR family transcriptional regulator
MEFEQLFLEISDIIHEYIVTNKENALKNSEFSDINMSQFYYLEAIYKLGNPTFSELAMELKISKASVTVAVNKLIQLNYVYKVQSDKDHRVYNIYITEKGKITIEIDKRSHREFSDYIKKCLNDDEIKELTKIFKKMIKCYSNGKK